MIPRPAAAAAQEIEVRDLYVPANPGSLTRAAQIGKVGWWRVSRRDAEFYSVLITSAGAWGHLRVLDGLGRPLFIMPSTFTGSFVHCGFAEGGIIVHLLAVGASPVVSLNFREPDTRIL